MAGEEIRNNLEETLRSLFPEARRFYSQSYYVVLDTCAIINMYRSCRDEMATMLRDCSAINEVVLQIIPNEVVTELEAIKSRKSGDCDGLTVPPELLIMVYSMMAEEHVIRYKALPESTKERILRINSNCRKYTDRNTRLGSGDCSLIGIALELSARDDPSSKVIIVSDDSDIMALQSQMNSKSGICMYYCIPSESYIRILKTSGLGREC